ncbi:major facilitator superfamily domain-containing protein [Aspergillus granulosus]|uniref:Major facilitator superfamily domain-containing protein n=1 Tax=Aspergillus granulosus TaxID=176169 RepID=A0ABR4H3Z1_9EURO
MRDSTKVAFSTPDSTECPGTILLVQQGVSTLPSSGGASNSISDAILQYTENLRGLRTNLNTRTVILTPQPANTVNDPLNWTKRKKLWHYTVHLVCVAWTSPAWTVWTFDLNTSYTILTYGQALLVVMCGFGVLFIQPWASKYGRRLPYILGSVLILCGLLCGRFMTDSRLYFAYQIVAGFGSAPAYSTIITSLLDVSFIHHRGSALALFGLVLVAGNFLPPIAAGYIVDSQGWTWCFNYLLILFGISSAILLVSGEETLFARDTFRTQNLDAVEAVQNTGIASEPDADGGKQSSLEITNTNPATSQTMYSESRLIDGRRLSYRQRMTLYRRNPDVMAGYWRLTLSMFQVAILPAAIWMSLMFSLGSFVVGVVLTTLASFFSIPPYNFSAATMGLLYLPLLIGAVIGSLWGGPCTDWLLLRLSRQNEGIYEPEHRLWTYLLIPVIGGAGILLYGVGAAQGLHWAIPCLGLIFIGIYLDASTPIAMGYGLDSYPGLEDEIVQLSNFLRNVLGGAFTFGLQSWINHSGAQITAIIIAAVIFALNATSVGFQLWGKSVRSWSAGRYFTIRDQAHRAGRGM